jgi:hypothetical protein
MSSPFPGVVGEFFLFGYLGYLWTHSFFFAAGVAFAVWVSGIAFTVTGQSEFAVFFIAPASLWLGTLLGWLVGNAALLTPLVPRLAYYMVIMVVTGSKSDEDSDLDGTYYIETFGRQQAVIVGAILMIIGIVMLLGTFGGNISFLVSLIVGIIFAVFGLALFIYGLYALFASERRADRADGRYLVYLLLMVVLLPLSYDLPARFFPPFEIFVFWVVLVAIIAAIIMIELNLVAVRTATPAISLENDARYLRNERYPARIIIRWVVVTALPLFIVQTTAWVVEEFIEHSDVDRVFIVVAVAAAVIALIAICCGGLSRTFGSAQTTPPPHLIVVQRQVDDEESGNVPLASAITSSTSAVEETKSAQQRQPIRSKTRRKGVDVGPSTSN